LNDENLLFIFNIGIQLLRKNTIFMKIIYSNELYLTSIHYHYVNSFHKNRIHPEQLNLLTKLKSSLHHTNFLCPDIECFSYQWPNQSA